MRKLRKEIRAERNRYRLWIVGEAFKGLVLFILCYILIYALFAIL